ncbi:hypothetical protein O3P69_009620 [Scylla paramamosain]|uniref:Uncharacterized protein n=1 Tax=Scylla paramamosain TaxID=85552 RepID=A0AAW0SU85_SCYPA
MTKSRASEAPTSGRPRGSTPSAPPRPSAGGRPGPGPAPRRPGPASSQQLRCQRQRRRSGRHWASLPAAAAVLGRRPPGALVHYRGRDAVRSSAEHGGLESDRLCHLLYRHATRRPGQPGGRRPSLVHRIPRNSTVSWYNLDPRVALASQSNVAGFFFRVQHPICGFTMSLLPALGAPCRTLATATGRRAPRGHPRAGPRTARETGRDRRAVPGPALPPLTPKDGGRHLHVTSYVE